MTATMVNDDQTVRVTAPAAGFAAGQVLQLADGRAAVIASLKNLTAGEVVGAQVAGKVIIAKTASIAILDGGEVFLDHSTGLAHFKKVNDRDFSLGVAVGDAAASATEVVVDLNVKPHWLIDLLRDPLMSVVVGTQAVGGLLPAQMRGGSLALNITATNEAQKVDALSVDGFGAAAKAIARFVLRLPNGGSGSASDFNFGLADDTHASNADTIANSIFFHLDGGSTNINAQSDDNTAHAVAATDTTIDFTAGVAVAHRVELWIDKRDPADVRFYVEGARVLPLVAFDVSAFTGTWKLLAHLEKASGTETADAIVDAAAVRILE